MTYYVLYPQLTERTHCGVVGLHVQLSVGKEFKSEQELALVLLQPMAVLNVRGRIWKDEDVK